MVGYVMLIVIAVGLSVAVFSFLKLYLPEDRPECSEDISLTLDSVSCTLPGLQSNNYAIEITMTNRGLFDVLRAQIRIGDSDRVFRTILNEGLDNPNDDFLLGNPDDLNDPLGLVPGESWTNTWETTFTSGGAKELEIEPIMYVDNQRVLCDNSVVKTLVLCP
ncbi:TPA: hypothetical protein EYQ19_02550 [Candidatus Pacearchaeota archaeon]|jgi:hypothetical protein|nr:hypothetical protein [Candidatus Pacearchaeota archaeon]